MQAALDFDRDVNLPVSGRTPAARQASATGAQAAGRDRLVLQRAYWDLLGTHGALSDFEAARILGRAVSSINSTRNAFGARVEPSGDYETATFADGRTTRRVRWQQAKPRQAADRAGSDRQEGRPE